MSFITVDSATFFKTLDVNNVDGDSANLQQSIGKWQNSYPIGSIALSTDITPKFGTNTLKITARSGPEAATVTVNCGTASDAPSASPATEYTFSVWVYCGEADRLCDPQLTWYDAANGLISHTYSSDLALTEDDWTHIELTGTSPALTDHVILKTTYKIDGGGNIPGGEAVYYDAACLRAGADGTFVPSLDIQADPTFTKDPAGIDATLTAGTDLTVGEAWAGDAVKVELLDGVGGPAVAVFDATDPTTVGDTDTWTDDTGRTWIVDGSGAVLSATGGRFNQSIAGPGQLLRTGG